MGNANALTTNLKEKLVVLIKIGKLDPCGFGKLDLCGFDLVVGARSTMLDECYSDTLGSKEVIGSIIRMCKESHGESFNLNPSPARSGSSLGHHFIFFK